APQRHPDRRQRRPPDERVGHPFVPLGLHRRCRRLHPPHPQRLGTRHRPTTVPLDRHHPQPAAAEDERSPRPHPHQPPPARPPPAAPRPRPPADIHYTTPDEHARRLGVEVLR